MSLFGACLLGYTVYLLCCKLFDKLDAIERAARER